MVSSAIALAAVSYISQAIAAPSYVAHPERTAAVKEAFQYAWDGYYTYAFPNDTLRPISQGYENDRQVKYLNGSKNVTNARLRNGWGASAVDALSTALILGNQEVVDQILEFVPTINFDLTAPGQEAVSVFETTIRYLGGLLSAYDLLTGPLSEYGQDQEAVKALLDQATHLADILSDSFDTPSGIPRNTLFVTPSGTRPSDEETNGIATIGTLILEWTRLSDLTGDPKYHELVQKAENYLLSPLNPELGEPFPGLIGTNLNVTDGLFVDSRGGWNGGTDSFYEYLIKMYLYDSEKYEFYLERWITAIDSSIEHLTSHPTSRPDITFLAAYRGANDLNFVSTHLACFDGGNFILGGLTLDRRDYIEYGLELVNGCHETYLATETQIGPEVFRWQDSKLPSNASNNQPPPAEWADFYEDAGFWIQGSSYVLRPEVIESYYYAYRATGDTTYQDWAWDAFVAINATTRAGVGYSSISDVNAPEGGEKTDFQESFFFAEVLKYSYLIQAEEAPWQVSADHDNRFVYNTEAHPLRAKGDPI
ncbi:hypothetical protein DL767_009926 [Monosporascus sp. MG133]|nr:hypothetical protein DL767_009926 [Monosporascus sp. MG133]